MSKKRKLTALLCALSVAACVPAFAEERGNPVAGEEFTAENYVQDAYDAANQGVEVVFPYQTNNIYQIYLQEGYITDIRLATMPFASASPISTPMGRDMSASDKSPAMVVSDEERISTMPFESATESACFTSAYRWRSSINLCSKIME